MSDKKPMILVIQPDIASVNSYRTELLKKHVKYSDDFVETEDAIYYVRTMSITIDLDKILLVPKRKMDRYDIQAWLDGAYKQIDKVKELADYKEGNISSTPPPDLNPNKEIVQNPNDGPALPSTGSTPQVPTTPTTGQPGA